MNERDWQRPLCAGTSESSWGSGASRGYRDAYPVPGHLRAFIVESNLIEGIEREPTEGEIAAHKHLLGCTRVRVEDLAAFVRVVAPGKPLRDLPGRDVIVGRHVPPPGGPRITVYLDALLDRIHQGRLTPFEAHREYETLHPFMDCNGRSGRALWAWQMQRDGHNPFDRRFLHTFYYQALDGSR